MQGCFSGQVKRHPREGGLVWGGARNAADGLIDNQSFDFWFDLKFKEPGWAVKKYRQQSPTIANNRQQPPTAKAEGRRHTFAGAEALGHTFAGGKAPGSCFLSSFLFLIHSWFEYRTGSRGVHVPGERDFQDRMLKAKR
jgi:hypothetical protein